MNQCVCWKTYKCLYCEDVENGLIVIVEGREIRKRPFVTNRLVAECGTRAGYNRHRRLGEETCAKCKAAQSEAVKNYMKQKNAS